MHQDKYSLTWDAYSDHLKEMMKEMSKDIPLQRANEPEDIAAMALFLASIGARNITGQSYNVDGGLVTS